MPLSLGCTLVSVNIDVEVLVVTSPFIVLVSLTQLTIGTGLPSNLHTTDNVLPLVTTMVQVEFKVMADMRGGSMESRQY